MGRRLKETLDYTGSSPDSSEKIKLFFLPGPVNQRFLEALACIDVFEGV